MIEDRLNVSRTFAALQQEVDKLLSVARPHPVVAELMRCLSGRDASLEGFVRRAEQRFQEGLHGPAEPATAIPRISHRIWLTDVTASHSPPDEYLLACAAIYEDSEPDWTHYFWTNSETVARDIQTVPIRLRHTPTRCRVSPLS